MVRVRRALARLGSQWRTPEQSDPFRKRIYCTYFDSLYLAQGLTMLRSLRKYDPPATICVLAFDDICAQVLRDLLGAEIQLIALETLHEYDPSLKACRRDRTLWAFYSTHKPALAQFVLERALPGASVIYIDADTWFFSNPAPAFEEIGGAPIGLSPHRFHARTQHLERYGLYNAGCICWDTSDTARECLRDWRNDCIQWCHEDVCPDGRFMNQGYLNRWPDRYTGVHFIRHPGINLASWNLDSHVLKREGRIRVDGQPLVFYHFSGIARDEHGQWQCLYRHFHRQTDLAIRAIYVPYVRAVESERRMLKRTYGIDGTGSVRSHSIGPDAVRIEVHSWPWNRGWLKRAGTAPGTSL